MSYLASASLIFYLSLDLALQFEHIKFLHFEKLKNLSLALGTCGFLVQLISVLGNFSMIQLKIFTRIPVLFALISFSMDFKFLTRLICLTLLLGLVLVITNFDKARYQARIYLKLIFMFCFYLFLLEDTFYGQVLSYLPLCFTFYYYFKFQESVSIQALIFKEMNK